MTVRRDTGLESAEMMMAGYAARLSNYPADIVEYVLEKWPNSNKFWPAWAELKEDLDFWNNGRGLDLEGIKNANI